MIALLGRFDRPTDGVDDYCNFLGQALARRGLALTRVHVSWNEEGWSRALRRLWRDSKDWREEWVLLQYTALSWSRRGVPWAVLAAAAMIRRRGAHCAVVFHEHTGYGGARVRERVRHTCQMWILRTLHRNSAVSVFTLPLDAIGWLPAPPADRCASKRRTKTFFIPIGANIPECADRRAARTQPGSLEREKRVVVFGITGAPAAAGEVADIASIAREASQTIPNLHLVVIGRGSSEAHGDLANALEGCSVSLDVRGVLPAEEVTRELLRADALLFVRGPVMIRRGSAQAGIACGLPIVGYGDSEPSGLIAEAGIEWAPWRDWKALAHALVRVLTDPQRWMELHERNVRVQEKYFSWNQIAELFIEALAE